MPNNPRRIVAGHLVIRPGVERGPDDTSLALHIHQGDVLMLFSRLMSQQNAKVIDNFSGHM